MFRTNVRKTRYAHLSCMFFHSSSANVTRTFVVRSIHSWLHILRWKFSVLDQDLAIFCYFFFTNARYALAITLRCDSKTIMVLIAICRHASAIRAVLSLRVASIVTRILFMYAFSRFTILLSRCSIFCVREEKAK